MYAVIRSGGKQHRVEPGTTLKVEKLDAEIGKKIDLDEVLMIGGEGQVQVGDPVLSKATVTATVLDHDRARKIIVFKKKRKKQYRRTRGHRQPYTELRVEDIKF
jgi:large subunit ribosomal protein L21